MGYQARIRCRVIAAFTAAAALSFHNDFADQNQMIRLLKHIAIVGGLLEVVAFGANALNLDDPRVGAA